MHPRYNFLHSCGHIGIGPVIRFNTPQWSFNQLSSAQDTDIETLQLHLFFQCPFCSNRQAFLNIEPGSGLLAMLGSSNSFFADTWQIIRVCKGEEVTPRDWDIGYRAAGGFQQMAWIPKPCGQVQYVNPVWRWRTGLLESEMTTELNCTWRQSLGDDISSRLPGMFSELRATLTSRGGNHNW